MTRTVKAITHLAIVAAAVAAAGCEAQKSSNPLSPTVAGPIGNVTIEAPAALLPANGTEVVNTAPLRLVLGPASSNSQRPFWFVVQIASDAAFNTRVYTNNRVVPNPSPENGQTVFVVDATLPAETTYYWRARAEDGANASEFSEPARFEVVAPVVIEAPTPRSPSGGETTDSLRPELVVTNGRVAGRAGQVDYRFVLSLDQAFTQIVSVHSTGRSDGPVTAIRPEVNLPPGTLFFWRAFGTNGAVDSPPSATQAFRTPAPAAPPAPAPGGGGGGGGTIPPPPPGGRTPNPPPGGRLPLPNMYSVVAQVAAQYPQALRNSCQHAGGTWEFMDRVVNALRAHDTRWGYNWKRGNVGDPSMDVVDYNWGSGPDEGSTNVYIIDIIVGHCGGDPSPGWGDVTDVTLSSGTIGRWTGRGRF
ncbi:hypothetical protein BH24ACI4_BH24ACI4_32280 [soil metagenome]